MDETSAPDSPEGVALSLVRLVFKREKRSDDGDNYRKYVLDLYAECLKAARGERDALKLVLVPSETKPTNKKSVVSAARKKAYGKDQHCGDSMALRLKEHFDGIATTVDRPAAIELGITVPVRKTKSVISAVAKARYGTKGNCGDVMSDMLEKYFSGVGTGHSLLLALAEGNGLDGHRWDHINFGMQRMNLGNCLRGLLNNGTNVKIDGVSVPI